MVLVVNGHCYHAIVWTLVAFYLWLDNWSYILRLVVLRLFSSYTSLRLGLTSVIDIVWSLITCDWYIMVWRECQCIYDLVPSEKFYMYIVPCFVTLSLSVIFVAYIISSSLGQISFSPQLLIQLCCLDIT